MILECHNKGVFAQPSLCNEVLNLFLVIHCIPVNNCFFKIEQHQDQGG